MSIDRRVCELVGARWHDLGLPGKPSENLVFMKIQGKLSANASIIGLVLDCDERKPLSVVKIPRNPARPLGVNREYSAMQAIRDACHDWEGSKRIPFEGFVEQVAGAKVLFQRAAVGHSMVKEIIGESSIRTLYADVLPWLLDFHLCNRNEVCLEGDLLETLVSKPINLFSEKMRKFPDIEISTRLRDHLAGVARDISGARISLASQHGDFNAHNIILGANMSGMRNFSVIDWEDFDERQLPIHDLSHFFISNSKLLDMKHGTGESFSKFIIESGWYQQLFVESVQRYENAGVIASGVYWKLVPLYIVTMCLRLMDEQRQQENTLGVWIARANEYVNRFPFLKS
jgi:hypothetical protein